MQCKIEQDWASIELIYYCERQTNNYIRLFLLAKCYTDKRVIRWRLKRKNLSRDT